MLSAISLLVYALAVARITRLINSDKITERPRDRLICWIWERMRPQVPEVERPYADEPLPAYLVTCPWCASIYVGAVAAPVVYFWGSSPWLLVPALALAFSHLTGLLAKLGE